MLKNLFFVSLGFFATLLTACSLGSSLTGVTDSTQEFSNKVSAIALAESRLYQNYTDSISLTEGWDKTKLLESSTNFVTAFNDLDKLVNTGKFSEDFADVIDEYTDNYMPLLSDYTGMVQSFSNSVSSGGLTFELLNQFHGDWEKYSSDFVKEQKSITDLIKSIIGG